MVVVNPGTVKNESLSVVMVTLFVPDGVKETAPVVVKVLLEPSVRFPLIVVVPAAAPNDNVVAAPPIDRFVAFELKIVAVAVVVVISADPAPFTAKSPPTPTLPVNVEAPSTVSVPFA